MPRAVDKHPQQRGVGASLYNPNRSGIASWSDPQSAIDDTVESAGDQIRKKIEDVINFIEQATGIDLSGLQAVLDGFSTAFNQIGDIVQGLFVTPISQAIATFQDWWNGLGAELTERAEEFQKTIDNIWSGLMRSLGLGKSSADLANAATNLASKADNARDLSEWNNAILGIRNNKSLMQGVDETEESTFLMSDLFSGTSEPPSMAVTATSVPIGFWRATETAKKGFISWFGKGYAGITGLYVDIYRMNYGTNTMQLIHTSANQIGLVDTGWRYLVYYIPDVANRIDVNAGDVLGIALRVVGSGTHTIAGKSAPWLPDHPTVIPARPAAVRTGSGNLGFGAITYSESIPWFGIGIVSGDTPTPYYSPRTTQYTVPGTYTFPIEPWMNFIDGSYCGAAGGGKGGWDVLATAGEGGDAGQWASETLERGVDFPVGATSLTITVGAGGLGGAALAVGTAGGDTIRAAIPSGKAALVAAGGDAGTVWDNALANGDSPGNYTFLGTTYIGGTGGPGGSAGAGSPGTSPGGGGGGGGGGYFGTAWPGGKGGGGYASLTARQS